MSESQVSRRLFIAGSMASFPVAALTVQAAERSAKMRVGVIGHTGRGNYGHGLDVMWLSIPNAEITGVADPNAGGRDKAQKRLKTTNGYGSYQDLLKAQKPEIVAVSPRQPNQHRDMMLASIEAGAKGIYVEKPFCRTPQEADEILAAAKKNNVKIAVAHRNRYHPTLKVIDRMLKDDAIGRVLEIRGRGKGDRRGGGEDLWVLGSHVLNLIHYFGGEPISCSANLRLNGRSVTARDVKPGNEALGPLAGNELHARFVMERGMIAYFDSMANDGTRSAGFGLQIIGSDGMIALQCDRQPLAFLIPGNPFQPTNKPRPWIPITSAGPGKTEPRKDLTEMISRHGLPGRDLIASIHDDRQPMCNAHQGAITVEMIHAVFASHQAGGAEVTLPLAFRGNALTKLK